MPATSPSPSAFAHGGLTTTPADLAVFAHEIIRAYQGQSDRVLSQASARRLLHRELDLDPRMFGIPSDFICFSLETRLKSCPQLGGQFP